MTTCAKTGFKIGERYLVSSSFGSGHNGYTSKVGFGDEVGVAWHVFPSDKVTLIGYGAGTQWDNVPDWLSAPQTLRQASVAIRL